MRKYWDGILRYSAGYYNVLLILLVLLFIFRPYDRSAVYLAMWKVLLAGVLLSAIFNCNHHRFVKIITLLLAIPTVILSWADFFDRVELIFVANTMLIILFLAICITSIISHSIFKTRSTKEALKGVICAYFMVAFLFGHIYYLIDYFSPGSFYFSTGNSLLFSYTRYISEMLYFSFVTLLTIGYGDIVAIRDLGQTAAIMEGVIGQFYVAILVARLVGVYSSYSDKKLLRSLEKDVQRR